MGCAIFLLYRDPCMYAATGGRVTKGRARFMYEDEVTLVEAGDRVNYRTGIVHHLFDYSPNMEYLEVVSPADLGTEDAKGPCAVPVPVPWKLV